MTTTTSYGTWCNHTTYDLTPEQTVENYLGDFYAEFDVDGLVGAYRAAIDDNLPAGVSLHGSEFIGPYDPDDRLGLGDYAATIREAIEAADLDELAPRFATEG